VVAAKSLLATALLALVSTSVALGDNPTVKLSHDDQARAAAALLRKSDFGVGWRGGRTKASPLKSPSCPGFDPKESDLVVTGHADARYTFQQGGVEVDQDVQVLINSGAVQKDFSRTISPALGRCLAFQLRKSPNVVAVSVSKLHFPPTGTVSAAYRAVVTVRSGKSRGKVLSDFVFFGEGRLEYSFNVVAPLGAGNQLVTFESALAQILLKRAGAAPA
jgi:hypothetical protein